MRNQFILIGRLREISELKEGRNKKYITIKLEVNREFKNADGYYESDKIKVTLRGNLATNLKEYCRVNDVIGIKGRLEETAQGNTILVGDKVTFLSSNSQEIKQNIEKGSDK